jgi:hypothetical protein
MGVHAFGFPRHLGGPLYQAALRAASDDTAGGGA